VGVYIRAHTQRGRWAVGVGIGVSAARTRAPVNQALGSSVAHTHAYRHTCTHNDTHTRTHTCMHTQGGAYPGWGWRGGGGLIAAAREHALQLVEHGRTCTRTHPPCRAALYAGGSGRGGGGRRDRHAAACAVPALVPSLHQVLDALLPHICTRAPARREHVDDRDVSWAMQNKDESVSQPHFGGCMGRGSARRRRWRLSHRGRPW
jgi:hypothetical protein